MEREPLVSIVVPTYNRLEYLRQAVQSVFDQSYRRWELIVVDDGSTDATPTYLASVTDPRMRAARLNGRRGAAHARNIALGMAEGTYVAFLDSDDLWLPGKLAAQLAALRDRAPCRWSYTFYRRIDDEGREIPLPPRRRWRACEGWILRPLLSVTAWVATPTVVAERALLQEVGGFDEGLEYSEDYELWLRLARRSEVTVVPQPLVSVRQHQGNMWRANEVAVLASWVSVYERLLGDAGLASIHGVCRRHWARANVYLAERLRAEGQYRPAMRVLRRSAIPGWTLFPWWVSLTKTTLRPWMPPLAMRGYHALRRAFARRPA